MADDIAALIKHLRIEPVDVMAIRLVAEWLCS
jgi:hypothetical protein